MATSRLRSNPRVEYDALLERVTLWDVGCERALELLGPDAVAFADYMLTRDVAGQQVGRCRHATACDERGVILCEALVLRLSDERVWICHGPADFPLWARATALHSNYEVEIRDAGVSPLALQGPLAFNVMEMLAADAASMPRFAWMWSSIADVDVLISRTGWSGEFGYEVFAPDVEPARRVWQEVRRAAEPFGVLVTPVVSDRAWERGVTDIRYGDNLDINPYEVGLDRTVDLDKGPFIGREALRKIAEGATARRYAVSFRVEEDQVPDFETFWPIADPDGKRRGVVWHVGYSYALEGYAGDALLDEAVESGAGSSCSLRMVRSSPPSFHALSLLSRRRSPGLARSLGQGRRAREDAERVACCLDRADEVPLRSPRQGVRFVPLTSG